MRRIAVGFIAFGVLPALAAAEPPVATVGKRTISRAEFVAMATTRCPMRCGSAPSPTLSMSPAASQPSVKGKAISPG